MKNVTAILLLGTLCVTGGFQAARAQDAARGKHVFRKCLLCHVLDPTATDHLAPPLHNIIGRRAATIKGFKYSSIMKYAGQKGFRWTREAMFYFLDKPEEFMPGTYMAFAGLEAQERKDVIAYLEKLTREYNAKNRLGKRSTWQPVRKLNHFARR